MKAQWISFSHFLIPCSLWFMQVVWSQRAKVVRVWVIISDWSQLKKQGPWVVKRSECHSLSVCWLQIYGQSITSQTEDYVHEIWNDWCNTCEKHATLQMSSTLAMLLQVIFTPDCVRFITLNTNGTFTPGVHLLHRMWTYVQIRHMNGLQSKLNAKIGDARGASGAPASHSRYFMDDIASVSFLLSME